MQRGSTVFTNTKTCMVLTKKIKLNTVKHPGTETYSGQIIIFQVQDTNLETSYQVKHWTESSYM
jgi:hypothetical protein